MKEKIVFSLVLILGISIGYFIKTRVTDSYAIRQYTPEYSFNKNKFKDSLWDIKNYEEYSVLEGYSDTSLFFVKLESALYEIQKKKESDPLKFQILIQVFGNLGILKTMKIQEMVENKFNNLDVVYMYTTYEESGYNARIGFIY
jgi:hypothetical protein